MDRTQLRRIQAPLKERYAEEPDAALIPASAEGRAGEGLTCTVRTWRGETVAGLHPATGGDGSEACSADMLLEALVACAGVTLSSVATVLGVDVEGAQVRAHGVWDARGTLGVSRAAPVGLTEVELSFDLPPHLDDDVGSKLIDLTERYCVIYQTLKDPPRVEAVRRAAPGGEA